MKHVRFISIVATASVLFSACAPTEKPVVATPQPTPLTQTYATPSTSPSALVSPSPTIKGKTMAATQQIAQIKTDKGVIEVELFADKAPNTVKNFLSKAASGFYEKLTFHRVEDWVIQGGDPVGNGTGGGKMPTELNDESFVEGSLGVARGPDIKVSNDAQFFICTTDCDWLTGQYTNFGKVVSGMDVAKKMAIGDKILSVTLKK